MDKQGTALVKAMEVQSGDLKLSDIRKHWEKEIRWGYVKLVRELDKKPNLEHLNGTIKALEAILRAYAAEGR